MLEYRAPLATAYAVRQEEYGALRITKTKAPAYAEAFVLVSLRSSNWKTIWASLERMSDRLEEFGIDSECYNRED